MEIKIGSHTITSITIFKIMFVMGLLATIFQVIFNVLLEKKVITEKPPAYASILVKIRKAMKNNVETR